MWIVNNDINVALTNGRKSKLPVQQFKKLASASPEELLNFKIIGDYSLHLPTLDEDLSMEGFFVKTEKEISLI